MSKYGSAANFQGSVSGLYLNQRQTGDDPVLPPSGVTGGVYGDDTNVPQITVGDDGIITSVTTVPVTFPETFPQVAMEVYGSSSTITGSLAALVFPQSHLPGESNLNFPGFVSSNGSQFRPLYAGSGVYYVQAAVTIEGATSGQNIGLEVYNFEPVLNSYGTVVAPSTGTPTTVHWSGTVVLSPANLIGLRVYSTGGGTVGATDARTHMTITRLA